MFGGDPKFEHRSLGLQGSEFVLKYDMFQPGRLLLSAAVTGILVKALMTLVFILIPKLDTVTEVYKVNLCMFAILVIVMVIVQSRQVASESVLVVRSLGIQLRTSYTLGTVHTEFYDVAAIKDVVITEAITMQSVICHIVLLQKSELCSMVQKIQPLYKHSRPSLDVLKTIYRITQQKLFIPQETGS